LLHLEINDKTSEADDPAWITCEVDGDLRSSSKSPR
jgi:CYTH domain-containing protein